MNRPIFADTSHLTEEQKCILALEQAIAQGHLKDHAAARHVIRDSTDLKTFQPQDKETWQAAYERYSALADR